MKRVEGSVPLINKQPCQFDMYMEPSERAGLEWKVTVDDLTFL